MLETKFGVTLVTMYGRIGARLKGIITLID